MILETLSGAKHTANHLKKKLTTQASTSTPAYAALHRAYSEQVQDVINLKSIAALGDDPEVGWDQVKEDSKKFLRQLPLTPHNLAATAEFLYNRNAGE